MQPWRAGDPVGCGLVYLPTKKLRDAYGAACVEAQIHADARAICAIPRIETRRARIAMYPAHRRDLLKAKVAEMWAKL